MMPDALKPGSTIGILGGGQLGRMLALAAAELGFRCHIYCPDPVSPAFDVAAATTIAAYGDRAALDKFASSVDVATYEFENIDLVAAEEVARICPLRPGVTALDVAQDRLSEKDFMTRFGIAVAAYSRVDDIEDLRSAVEDIGYPSILKTRRFGYDGKGQARIASSADLPAALQTIGNVPAILEAYVDFSREISVIGVRDLTGRCATYPVSENVHRDHILHTSTVPASVAPETAEDAASITETIMTKLDYVGVIGVEFFVVSQGDAETLLVNEIAPRVHNSGHWTQDGCSVSQFENHIRAIAGWPAGQTTRHSDVVMTNLIGSDADTWQSLAAEADAHLHLYGKRETRPGRKMGHVNRITRRL